ncbi:CAP domain-containing protein [Coemansia spiralis]|nr:CAP domain-containing protein [Coemansia spiralis]
MSRMLGLINDLRRSQGLHAVEYNDKLLRLAQNHAKFQADFKVVTHADTGGTLGERLSALGFTWNVLAENVGAGASNEKEIFDAWSKSPGHLANLLQPDVRYMGVSVNNGYWVQDFASSGSNTN